MSGMSGMAAMSGDELPGFRAKSSDCPHRSQILTISFDPKYDTPSILNRVGMS